MAALTSKKYRFAFIMVTSLFFFWGFVHNLDPVLIKHLKKAFTLNTLQSSLVDSAVFIAYFLMALPAGYVMKKFGYKAGVILGLVLFAIGSFLFIPAANTQQYAFFLGALFVIASGLTFLETAANPYADLLGDPETSTQRLNLSQSFNGLAATMAPIIGVNLILTKDYSAAELAGMTEEARKLALAAEASTVKTPYLILGLCILLVAIIFWFTHLPEVKQTETAGKEKSKSILHAFRHAHLSWAVVAQFFYVGAQVCVFSFFLLYAPKAAGVSDKVAGNFLGWGCGLAFMVGRFFGTYLMVEIVKPARLLSIYALINIVLCAVAMFASGIPALIAVIGIAFFMSIMFPTIFSLGIKDLGTDTEYGSSLIIMSIVGGAILPPVFGWIADSTGNIQLAYIVPLFCFAVILLFGLKGYKVKSLTDAPKKSTINILR
jgi:FHS family L-fucose permease-like MFS transporter